MHPSIASRAQSLLHECYRHDDRITLVAVSKSRSVDEMRQAYSGGIRHFGENYVDEALGKIPHFHQWAAIWHFIGPIQSNKTKKIAENFQWVHSVDRTKIAERLNGQRPAQLPKLNICIQLNLDKEPQKAGIYIEDLDNLAEFISTQPNLILRGLMIIPDKTKSPIDCFKQAHNIFKNLQKIYPSIDTLSMGMSADWQLAIANGSNMVRIGTELFGKRIK